MPTAFDKVREIANREIDSRIPTLEKELLSKGLKISRFTDTSCPDDRYVEFLEKFLEVADGLDTGGILIEVWNQNFVTSNKVVIDHNQSFERILEFLKTGKTSNTKSGA